MVLFYAFDNEWQEEYDFTLFLLRFGVAETIFFVLSVVLVLVANRIFRETQPTSRKDGCQ